MCTVANLWCLLSPLLAWRKINSPLACFVFFFCVEVAGARRDLPCLLRRPPGARQAHTPLCKGGPPSPRRRTVTLVQGPAGVVSNSMGKPTKLGTTSWGGLFRARRHPPGQHRLHEHTDLDQRLPHPDSWAGETPFKLPLSTPSGSPSPTPAGYLWSTTQENGGLRSQHLPTWFCSSGGGRQRSREPLLSWRTRPSEPPSPHCFRPTLACGYSCPRPRKSSSFLLLFWGLLL